MKKVEDESQSLDQAKEGTLSSLEPPTLQSLRRKMFSYVYPGYRKGFNSQFSIWSCSWVPPFASSASPLTNLCFSLESSSNFLGPACLPVVEISSLLLQLLPWPSDPFLLGFLWTLNLATNFLEWEADELDSMGGDNQMAVSVQRMHWWDDDRCLGHCN